MNLKSITPKFIRRVLVLREYRMTKAMIRYLKDPPDGKILIFKDILDNYKDTMLRPKTFYEGMVKYYNDSLIQNEGLLEELKHEMKELGLKPE